MFFLSAVIKKILPGIYRRTDSFWWLYFKGVSGEDPAPFLFGNMQMC